MPIDLAKEVKLCVVGDTHVGKTCIVNRFISDQFTATDATIGASFRSKNVTVGNRSLRFHIWDTAGQERYRSLTPMYYRGAQAALVVYDITKRDSFTLLKYWIQELMKYSSPDIVLAVAGNKVDLGEERDVNKKEAVTFANDIGAIFMETSAKTSSNIVEIFKDIANRLIYIDDDHFEVKVATNEIMDSDRASTSCCWCGCRQRKEDHEDDEENHIMV